MIQFNPEVARERAAALLLLEQLRDQQRKIQAEMDRITRQLEAQLDEESKTWPGQEPGTGPVGRLLGG